MRLKKIILFGLFIFLCNCSTEKNAYFEIEKTCGNLPSLQYAKHFKIGTLCGEQILEINSTIAGDTIKEIFILRDSANYQKEVPAVFSKNKILQVPLKKIIPLTTAQIGYLLALQEERALVGIGNVSYLADSTLYEKITKKTDGFSVEIIGNEQATDFEKILMLSPNLVMTFSTGARYDNYEQLKKINIPLMLTSEWQESSPLGKAEWIKLYGALFAKEKFANEIFEKEKERFLTLEKNVLKNDSAKKIKVLVGVNQGSVWYIPSKKSYTMELIKKAGGTPLFESETGTLSFEEIFAKADSIDVWINPGMFSSAAEILTAEPRVKHFKAWKEKRVYQNDKRKGPEGGNDFYESAVVNPARVLQDFIHILNENDDLIWYRNIFE